MFSYVLLTGDVENVEKPMVLEGFRHARAAAARMCAAWYYLTGMAPRAGARKMLSWFDVRAKVAREGHFDRNVQKPLVFKDSARARGQIFETFWMRKSYVFICFIDMRC